MTSSQPQDGAGRSRREATTGAESEAPVTLSTASSSEHFDEVADSWIQRYADRPSFRHRLVAVGAVVREIVAKYDSPAVLDFGGGPGVFSLVASEEAHSVLCLDTSVGMIREGFAHESTVVSLIRSTGYEPRPERVRRMMGALDALDRRANSRFDVVLAIAVLEYLADPQQVLAELADHMRAGGRLVLTVPNERSWFRRVENLAGSLGAGTGSMLRWERLRNRAYASTRPHGNRVPWWAGADAGGLILERMVPLALASSGLMSHVTATQIVVLRKRPLAS